MIPLSQWLCDQHAQDGERLADSPEFGGVPFEHDETNTSASVIDEAYERGRQEALAEMEARTQALGRLHQEALAELEATLNAKWVDLSADNVGSKVAAAFDDLRRQLEASVMGSLQSFLEEAVLASASAGLLDLLCEEAARASDPILEIRAPAILHEGLSARLSRSGIVTSLSESESIEVIARDGTTRFESMASRWINLVRGGEA